MTDHLTKLRDQALYRFHGSNRTDIYHEAAAEAITALIEAREAHTENARILGYLVNELQGRVEAGKFAAVVACWTRSKAARDSIDALGKEKHDDGKD